MQSERSNDMFCDDIFGDSPAGVRKMVCSNLNFTFVDLWLIYLIDCNSHHVISIPLTLKGVL